MVHCRACPAYQTAANAAKYRDPERGPGDCDEAGGITSRINHSWNELYSSTIGQFDAPTARYQEGQGRSRQPLMHLVSCRWTYQGYMSNIPKLFAFWSLEPIELHWYTMVPHMLGLWAST